MNIFDDFNQNINLWRFFAPPKHFFYFKIIATIEIRTSEIMGFAYSRYKFQKKVEKYRTLPCSYTRMYI